MPALPKTFSAWVLTVLLMQVATAGQLDDFEADAGNNKSESAEKSRSYDTAETSAFGSGTYPSESGGRGFLEGFWSWLVASPFDYRHDDPSARLVAEGDAATEDWADAGNGLNVRHLPGSAVLPYLRADYNRQYIDANLDAEDIRLEAGYQFSSHITGRLFGLLKKGSGLSVPTDFPGFPDQLTDEMWYQHDRTLKHNYMNIGIGLDWALNDHYSVSSNLMTMVWADQVNLLDYAFTLSLARTF